MNCFWASRNISTNGVIESVAAAMALSQDRPRSVRTETSIKLLRNHIANAVSVNRLTQFPNCQVGGIKVGGAEKISALVFRELERPRKCFVGMSARAIRMVSIPNWAPSTRDSLTDVN